LRRLQALKESGGEEAKVQAQIQESKLKELEAEESGL